MYKNFVDINLPTETADGYYLSKNKDQVDHFIYLDEDWYNQLFDTNVYYILGSKGSGKTLYAAYMCADIRKSTVSRFHTIDVGDYGKLIAMKTLNHLNYTDYLTMWKVILLQKLLLGLDATEISFFGRAKNYKTIQDTISSYFGYDVTDDSFNPITVIDSCGKQSEVTGYLNSQFSVSAAALNSKVACEAQDGSSSKQAESADSKIERVAYVYTDTWLRAIDAFRQTMKNISFRHSHFLFIDGLDVRPSSIDAKEYGECIGALVRAVFEINTKILGNMARKDHREFKIIALTRTDIFLNSNLVNVTSCINDNCVKLDWTYNNESEFHFSSLYKMMNRVLGWDGKSETMPVDTYLAFQLDYPIRRPLRADLYIQRQSRLRPRDIIVLLRHIQAECRKRHVANPTKEILCSPGLLATYSDYYTDQVKSEMMFTYSRDEIKSIFELMKVLDNEAFSDKWFEELFRRHCAKDKHFSEMFSDHRKVIDVLYSLDLVGWKEGYGTQTKVHWHYREVKAIDEMYQLPWEQFDKEVGSQLIIHKGASKHVLGFVRK